MIEDVVLGSIISLTTLNHRNDFRIQTFKVAGFATSNLVQFVLCNAPEEEFLIEMKILTVQEETSPSPSCGNLHFRHPW
jgi:hypothetical protein